MLGYSLVTAAADTGKSGGMWKALAIIALGLIALMFPNCPF